MLHTKRCYRQSLRGDTRLVPYFLSCHPKKQPMSPSGFLCHDSSWTTLYGVVHIQRCSAQCLPMWVDQLSLQGMRPQRHHSKYGWEDPFGDPVDHGRNQLDAESLALSTISTVKESFKDRTLPVSEVFFSLRRLLYLTPARLEAISQGSVSLFGGPVVPNIRQDLCPLFVHSILDQNLVLPGSITKKGN